MTKDGSETRLRGENSASLTPKEANMADLTKEEVRALGHAVGLEIEDPELTEVTYSSSKCHVLPGRPRRCRSFLANV